MAELTWVGEALRWVGWLYWLLALGALVLVLTKIKPIYGKVIGAGVVVAVFGYLPIIAAWKGKQVVDARKAARVHFEMRCKGAGEKIYRTVEGVDEILLLKGRPKVTHADDKSQYWMGDPYGNASGGDSYIYDFLVETYNANASGSDFRPARRPAYKFVEAVDPADNIRYRYTVVFVARPNSETHKPVEGDYVMHRTPVNGTAPRYGVIWDDISTFEDRNVWVAGGSLKVIDLQTNEIIAERIGYLIDPGQGDLSGGRSPWSWARYYSKGCPPIESHNHHFVSQVLKMKHGE